MIATLKITMSKWQHCKFNNWRLLFGSRPSDHYFRSVCWFVCLCRVFLSRLWSDL